MAFRCTTTILHSIRGRKQQQQQQYQSRSTMSNNSSSPNSSSPKSNRISVEVKRNNPE